MAGGGSARRAVEFARIAVQSPKWRLAALVFALLFLSYLPFQNAARNANVLGRLALTANFVQHGRVDINGYDKLTTDKAFYGKNYYSDKALGMSLLAAPAAYIFTRFANISPDSVPEDTRQDRRWPVFAYVCALSTSGLLTALAGACLFGFLLRNTGNVSAALFGSVAYALATPAWGWATTSFGHATAAALLILGLIAVDTAAEAKARKLQLSCMFLGGGALGLAGLVEFPAAVPAVLIWAYALARFILQKRLLDGLILCSAGGIIGGLASIPLLIYNWAAFGSAFHLGYRFEVGFNGLQSGFFGVGVPRLDVLREILVGARRGVLWLSPILAFAPVALIDGFRFATTRLVAFLVALVTAWYLLMNSGYFYWDGGYSTGPRHITPAYPFLALALGLWASRLGGFCRIALVGVLGVSVALSLACVSVTMTPREEIQNPLVEVILPDFFRGHLSGSISFMATKIEGPIHLAPLAAIWASLGWLIWREARKLHQERFEDG